MDHEHTKKKDHIFTDCSETGDWIWILWITIHHANRYAMPHFLQEKVSWLKCFYKIKVKKKKSADKKKKKMTLEELEAETKGVLKGKDKVSP